MSNHLINLWGTYIFAGLPSLALGDGVLHKMSYKMLKGPSRLAFLDQQLGGWGGAPGGWCVIPRRAVNVACLVRVPKSHVDEAMLLPLALSSLHSRMERSDLMASRQIINRSAPPDHPPERFRIPVERNFGRLKRGNMYRFLCTQLYFI